MGVASLMGVAYLLGVHVDDGAWQPVVPEVCPAEREESIGALEGEGERGEEVHVMCVTPS